MPAYYFLKKNTHYYLFINYLFALITFLSTSWKGLLLQEV